MANKTNDILRAQYLAQISEMFSKAGEQILVTGSNEIAIPCVDANGDDQYIVVTVKVPSGSRDGEAYDGFAIAEDYAIKQRNKAAAKAESEKKKAAKIARDEAQRAAKKAAKEKAKA